MAMGVRIIRPAGAPPRVGIVGAVVLTVAALAAVPDAKADPPPGCFQGSGPQPTPGCAIRAFVADMTAAGLKDSSGNTVAVDQALDMCGLMDRGLSRPDMVSQFLRDNPALGPNGAAQVVSIAINDLCPWHR